MADETPVPPAGIPDLPGAPEQIPSPGGAETEAKTGFFSTRNGRIVLIGGAVAVLLVVAGVAAAVLLAVLGMTGAQSVVTSVTSVTPVTATTPTSTTDGASAVASTMTIAPIDNSDVYVVRDPFQPLLSLPLATATVDATANGSSTNTTSSSSSSTTSTADDNTLTLVSISVVDGVYKGTFTVGGATIVAGAGQRLGSTPWQVVSMDSDSAVVLYGDEQVTLVVGQGISK